MTSEHLTLWAEIREDLYAVERKIDALYGDLLNKKGLGADLDEERRIFRDSWEDLTQAMYALLDE
jgi:hypothetical protein